MTTILTHPAVALAIAVGFGRGTVPGRLLAAGIAASVLPDLDVIAFRLGVPYASEFGHRGFTHSLLFALFVAVLCGGMCRHLQTSFLRALLFGFAACASHGVLDAFTTGGLGVEFFWPWSSDRYFAPYQVIQVSPIGASRLFSEGGGHVLTSELIWVWLPAMGLAVTGRALREWHRGRAV
jgi:inner membrane protein